ncbi:MAG: hypothetical protein KDB23_30885, partial [Planctomycetales bacterium]|nr:hypothetical protein [Planctomycetales bacterium]
MAAEFNRLGFQFLYPENWTVDVEETTGWPRSVALHSPNGAMWSATADASDVETLRDRIVNAVSAEYEQVEQSPVTRMVGDLELEGIELNFYCLDFLVIAQILSCPSTDRPSV